MKSMNNCFLFIAAAAVFSFCNEPLKPANAGKDVFADNVDSTANPADDFFQFVNGKWFKSNPIPGSETNWGIGKIVREEIYNNLKKINQEAASANAAEGTDTKKIGDFWSTGMDSVKADKLGTQPLQKQLDMISAVKDVKGIVQTMVALEPLQVGFFYAGFYVTQDAKNSEVMGVTLWQGGIGLPDRDYYFNDEKEIRENYVQHLTNMLGLIGETPADAKKKADGIMAFETGLAMNSRKLEDQRDPFANYNKMSIDDVTRVLTPSISWRDLAAAHSITKIDSIVVGQPEFLSGLEKSLKATDVEILKAY
ncbi:MAG: M13 family metallopeptidase, partial [Bacteroidota bacterium]|nr:M13 family metallopeptidase [Bacteroidota bacterium]